MWEKFVCFTKKRLGHVCGLSREGLTQDKKLKLQVMMGITMEKTATGQGGNSLKNLKKIITFTIFNKNGFFLKSVHFNSDEISLALKKCISMRSLALGASENKYSSYFYSFRGTNNYFMKLPLSNSWSSTKMEGLNH